MNASRIVLVLVAAAAIAVALLVVQPEIVRPPESLTNVDPNAPAVGSTGEVETDAIMPVPVDLEAEYDLSGLTIPRERMIAMLQRDAIPALTDPKREPVSEVAWLEDDDRIVVVRQGDEVLGVPIAILDFHEIVNASVGDEPFAVTYCPLCDSAAAFSRRVPAPQGEVVLDFGVSGALYQSNLLMYDRRDRALWSQLGMRAVSGPLSGTSLPVRPIEVLTLAELRSRHPGAEIVGRETGHFRPYGRSPYAGYAQHDVLWAPVDGMGDALPKKTLGAGVLTADVAWFVPIDRIGGEVILDTGVGRVVLTASRGGIGVRELPPGVSAVQTFYFAWSAQHPHTRVWPD